MHNFHVETRYDLLVRGTESNLITSVAAFRASYNITSKDPPRVHLLLTLENTLVNLSESKRINCAR